MIREETVLETTLHKIEEKFRLPGFILFTTNRKLREKYFNTIVKLCRINPQNRYCAKHSIQEWKELLEV